MERMRQSYLKFKGRIKLRHNVRIFLETAVLSASIRLQMMAHLFLKNDLSNR